MVKKEITNTNKADGGDYKELVNFLAVKFDEVNSKFDEVNGKFEEVNNQFAEVNRKLDQKPDRVEVAAMIKTDTDRVMDRIGQINDKIDDYRAEQIGLKRQVDRLV